MARPKYKDKKYQESSVLIFMEGIKNPEQISFLQQFNYNPKKKVAFVYSEGDRESFRAVLEIAKYAECHRKLVNFNSGDTTPRYITIFDKTAGTYADYIGLMSYALYQCGCTQFLDLFCESKEKEIFLRNEKHHQKTDIASEKWFDYSCFFPIIQEIENCTSNFLFQKCTLNQSLYKSTYRTLLESLELDQELYIKWKNEYYMYSLIKCYYPDAVFQFHDTWLGRQSLDTYVPSIKTGFEYQGIQHFEPVDFFGGEEHFQQRLKLDQLKRGKCAHENIKLIEWNFDEALDRTTLSNKLNKFHIMLPPRCSDLFSTKVPVDLSIDSLVHSRKRSTSPDVLDTAIESKNTEQLYKTFMLLFQQKNNIAVRDALLKMKELWSCKEMFTLYRMICDRDKFHNTFISLIVHNEELLRYYVISNDSV